jgi:hypothetical protein
VTGDRAYWGSKTNAELAVTCRLVAADEREKWVREIYPTNPPDPECPHAAFLEELAERLTTLKGKYPLKAWESLQAEAYSDEA